MLAISSLAWFAFLLPVRGVSFSVVSLPLAPALSWRQQMVAATRRQSCAGTSVSVYTTASFQHQSYKTWNQTPQTPFTYWATSMYHTSYQIGCILCLQIDGSYPRENLNLKIKTVKVSSSWWNSCWPLLQIHMQLYRQFMTGMSKFALAQAWHTSLWEGFKKRQSDESLNNGKSARRDCASKDVNLSNHSSEKADDTWSIDKLILCFELLSFCLEPI